MQLIVLSVFATVVVVDVVVDVVVVVVGGGGGVVAAVYHFLKINYLQHYSLVIYILYSFAKHIFI